MKAFSLLESVLAMLIIGAGFVAVSKSFQGTGQSTVLAEQTIVAINLASETLERIAAQRNNSGYTTTLTSINSGTYTQNPVSGFSAYSITTTATEVSGTSSASPDSFTTTQSGSGYARITVTVFWNNLNNSVKLESLIAEYSGA